MRRISVGGGLARAAWGGFMRAAAALAETGNFDALADAPPHSVVNALFSDGLMSEAEVRCGRVVPLKQAAALGGEHQA